jgi:putative nucleotidyltransferase with HDIG domain
VSGPRRPPRLLVKTLAVTFATVALLLVAVFVVVTFIVRDQVRQTVSSNLESSQRVFGAIEARRQRELSAQVAALAESPRLKAAVDTYAAEATTNNDPVVREQWLTTIRRQLEEVAARMDSDAIVLTDVRNRTLAAAGRLADRWPRDRQVVIGGAGDRDRVDGIARMDGVVFRVVSVPFDLDGVRIGALYLATGLDRRYADDLATLAGARTAIVSDGRIVASTLSADAARAFEAALAGNTPASGIVTLDGESHAFRRLVDVTGATFYALTSIDGVSREPTARAIERLSIIALCATLLALAASFWLARMITEPIGLLSTSLRRMAASRDMSSGSSRLIASGSSREIDGLIETFNALVTSVTDAEDQTQGAYTGAIRALATALDARDPYTAGHSERVSVLSVAIGRSLRLRDEEIEVIRLGALLHDIGKIGVPDSVLLKPTALTPAEFDIIKQHPGAGARILQSVPFLAPHIPIVELHHERPDGHGYPHGLRGDEIPIAAHIVHVADAYDAMTTARAYRRARHPTAALQELWQFAGTAFHAEAVGALATVLPGVISDSGEVVLERVHA